MPTSPAVVSLVTTGSVSAANFSYDRNGGYGPRLWWGDLAELLIYDRALTNGERQSIEGYLEEKYALGSELAAPLISPGTRTNRSKTVPFYAGGGRDRKRAEPIDGDFRDDSAPITVTQSRTIKAKAYKEYFEPSTVSSATYTMRVANPGLSAGGGTYSTPQTVSVTCVRRRGHFPRDGGCFDDEVLPWPGPDEPWRG